MPDVCPPESVRATEDWLLSIWPPEERTRLTANAASLKTTLGRVREGVGADLIEHGYYSTACTLRIKLGIDVARLDPSFWDKACLSRADPAAMPELFDEISAA